MALFPKVTEFKYFQWPSGASQSVGVSEIQSTFVLPRQSRRLERITIHANVTIASPATVTSATALENIFPKIELKVSDAAGSNRSVISTNSATLIAKDLIDTGLLDWKTRQAWGQLGAGTFDLFINVDVRNLLISEAIGIRTCLPLSAPALADDVRLNLTLANFADIGLANTSTVTVNATNLIIAYREVPDTIGYVPSEFITNSYAWGGGSGNLYYDFPQNGLLAAFMVEEFSSATARGTVLGGTGSGSGQGHWKFRFGRSDREEWTTFSQMAEGQRSYLEFPSDFFGVNSILTKSNANFAWIKDFLHDTPLSEALSPASCYNLYATNAGDRAQLNCTNFASGGITLISTRKFLTTNPQDLVGA